MAGQLEAYVSWQGLSAEKYYLTSAHCQTLHGPASVSSQLPLSRYTQQLNLA